MSFRLGKSGGEEQERTKNSSQRKMESVFQLGETFSHAHSGLNSFANRARQHLSNGPDHIPLRKQTLICGYFLKTFYHLSNRRRGPEIPDS